MADWSFETLWRDFQNRPLLYPFFRAYSAFGDIKRTDSFPFYISPLVKKGDKQENNVMRKLDWLCDAHEEARNEADDNKSFYLRSIYVYNNFLRYQNETVRNVMFDTNASKHAYAKLNSIIA